MKYEIFLGLNDKDTKVQMISTLDAYQITVNILNSKGINAFTIRECKGFYTHEDKTTTIETTLNIILVDVKKAQVQETIEQLKNTFNQESVMLTSQRIATEFL